ncbi:PREDICTED: uncharacterized protein LOC105002504 [Bison bison bison]|uniref:Uncharacterized protein LOC105002504 n=1 Tax=Bison bison bison TaxID=43346 RepID=A0A6P3J2A3_BISBB|nr:PREDICTED: uncharacterized protein LOC105002504 [Bison bison bison]
MRKWATCQLSACPHRETNTAVQAAPRGASVLGPAPSPVTWPGSHQTWCSLHVAEGTTGPSGGLARQVLRVHKAVLVSAGQGQWLGLRPSWATWMGGAVAEALCVDVEGCAPAELPWATLLGVICESGHSHPPGASSWGTRKVTNAEGRAVLPQLPTSQASFTPPPHPRTLRAFWLAVCGDPAVGVSQVPDLCREPAGLPVRTAPPGAQRLL